MCWWGNAAELTSKLGGRTIKLVSVSELLAQIARETEASPADTKEASVDSPNTDFVTPA